jgi:hypothetical protein
MKTMLLSLIKSITSLAASTVDHPARKTWRMPVSLCNRHKGTDVAAIDPDGDEVVRLFHPRRDRWVDHSHLAGEYIESRTAVGKATVRLLQLNSSERLAERRLFQELGTYAI